MRFKWATGCEKWMKSKSFKKAVIHVRFVTRGTNRQTICESLEDMQKVLNDPTLKAKADWVLEVLTDNYVELGESNRCVSQIVVPKD